MAEKWIDCSSCNGTGLIHDDYTGRTIECHRCGGSGLFRNPNYKEENDNDSDGVGLEEDNSDNESTFGLFGTIGSVIGGIFSAVGAIFSIATAILMGIFSIFEAIFGIFGGGDKGHLSEAEVKKWAADILEDADTNPNLWQK